MEEQKFTNPTKPAVGKPTVFELHVRLHGFEKGVPKYTNKGEKITVPHEQAERWEKQGLGKILGDPAPVEVRGKDGK